MDYGEQPPVVVTGIKPTGAPHLGNYLGMIRPAIELAARHPAYVFVADGHAMTTVEDPSELKTSTYDMAAALMALGLDPSRSVLYRQSDMSEVFELAWVLSCSTPKGLLNRAHAYKAVTDANRRRARPLDEGVSAGLFSYPVLMAADVAVVGGDLVPVGRDQLQHLEIARDIVSAFNRAYGPILAMPEPVVDPAVETIAGTDGQKMSKSYGNVLPIFEDPEVTARRIRQVVTDSRRPEEPKDPEHCPLFALYRHLADPGQTHVLAGRYRSGGVGYSEVKDELALLFERRFGEPRRRYHELVGDRAGLEAVLAEGARRARRAARSVLGAVRAARGAAA